MKAFRYKDYRPDTRKTTPMLPAMKDSLIPIDLFKHIKYVNTITIYLKNKIRHYYYFLPY